MHSFPVRSRFVRASLLASLLAVGAGAVFSQENNPNDPNRRRRGGTQDNANPSGGRGNFNPQDMQARMLTALRERLEITDDEEWKVISDRISKVTELRRTAAGSGFGGFAFGRGGPGGGGGDPGSTRGGRGGGSPEVNALQSALRDKLPDAEIKSRLERVREKRKESEAQLTKAQEELRAVLTIRQEAVLVAFGLLP